MKKVLFWLLFCVISMTAAAQKKSAPLTLEGIERNAKVWFKKYYVDPYFKDPYSYKLVKCFAVPVYESKELEKTIADLQKTVDGYSLWRKNNPTSYEKYAKDLHKSDSLKLILLKEKYNALTEKQKKEPSYYIVYIHCYAKNSYGNTILGKYKFIADEKGEFSLDSVSDLSE